MIILTITQISCSVNETFGRRALYPDINDVGGKRSFSPWCKSTVENLRQMEYNKANDFSQKEFSMKIAAIIEEFNDFTGEHEQLIANVRRLSQADVLIAVMSGDFIQQGVPARQDKFTRARRAVAAGVDLVIELPVYCTLSSPDTYAYAAVSTLESLHCVDELYIACGGDGPRLLPQVARFLFIESRDYQLRLKSLRTGGLSFYDAQAAAVGYAIPKASTMLKNPVNIFAAEYLRALKRIYSRIRPCFVQADGLSPLSQTDTSTADSAYLSALLRYELMTGRRNMDEIYGGTSMLTKRIIRAQNGHEQFNEFAGQLKTATRSQANIRRYLLNYILDVRKADIAICRLYSFTPYLRIIAIRPEAAAAPGYIQSHTRTPVFIDREDAAQNTASIKAACDPTPCTAQQPVLEMPKLDAAIAMLADFDSRAHKLYRLAFPQNMSCM